MYLFVDSTRELLEKNIELIISLTCLPRWYDAVINETPVLNEKPARGMAEKISIDSNPGKIIGNNRSESIFKESFLFCSITKRDYRTKGFIDS